MFKKFKFRNKNNKFLGKFNIIDCVIVGVIALLIISALIIKNGLFNPVHKIAKGAKQIEFTVVTRAYDVTSQDEIIKKGDKTFITIRNVPYTKLEVHNVTKEAMKEMYFNYDRPEIPYLIKNVAYPHRYQYVIKLRDYAMITNDGAVLGGNKIKIGLPVDIEGFNYRLSGMVTDVKVLEELK